MAPQKPSSRSTLLSNHTLVESNIKVAKRPYKKRIAAPPGVKYRNGLLNAAIPARSALMQIAKRNSAECQLLRLPGEIRNKIWAYAVGYNQIDIGSRSSKRSWPIGPTLDVRPLHFKKYPPCTLLSRPSNRPTFALPKVCRQMYVETSPLIYTLNTFGFDDHNTFDRWIKNRAPGQKRLVTSINIPHEYTRLYCNGFRKLFRQKFPNIKRIGVDASVSVFSRHSEKDSAEDAKLRIIHFFKEKEGKRIEVDWQY